MDPAWSYDTSSASMILHVYDALFAFDAVLRVEERPAFVEGAAQRAILPLVEPTAAREHEPFVDLGLELELEVRGRTIGARTLAHDQEMTRAFDHLTALVERERRPARVRQPLGENERDLHVPLVLANQQRLAARIRMRAQVRGDLLGARAIVAFERSQDAGDQRRRKCPRPLRDPRHYALPGLAEESRPCAASPRATRSLPVRSHFS